MNADSYQGQAARTICPQSVALQRLSNGVQDQDDSHVGSMELMTVLHCVIGKMGELGELATLIEKCIWYGQKFDKVNFLEELGDDSWYTAEGLTAMKKKLSDTLEKNIAKLRARFPEKYTDDLALEANRNRDAERRELESGPAKSPPLTEPTLRELARLASEPNGEGARAELRLLANRFNVSLRVETWDTVVDALVANLDKVTRMLSPWASNPDLEQNGHGWAEPPVEEESKSTVSTLGKEKTQYSSYDRKCSHPGCKNMIHRENTCGVCGQCAAALRAAGNPVG